MKARMTDGEASARVERRSRPPRYASRQPDRSQVIAPAQAAGRRDVLTLCKTKTSAFHQRPPSGMKERLGPPSGPATIPRTTDARIPPAFYGWLCVGEPDRCRPERLPPTRSFFESLPFQPDLLNQPKGLSMAKIARVSLQLVRKFVPVADLPKGAQLPKSRTRETMILSGYTLCEVYNRDRQELPVSNHPISDPAKSIRSVIRRLDHFYDLLTEMNSTPNKRCCTRTYSTLWTDQPGVSMVCCELF